MKDTIGFNKEGAKQNCNPICVNSACSHAINETRGVVYGYVNDTWSNVRHVLDH